MVQLQECDSPVDILVVLHSQVVQTTPGVKRGKQKKLGEEREQHTSFSVFFPHLQLHRAVPG